MPQNKQEDGKAGTLYLCATPIGNLRDITQRVLDTLTGVDLIAAEDTRGSIKLLNHYDIHTPMTSYHEHNKYEKAEVLIEKLRAGYDVALITDAGTPAISDPGEVLVARCIAENIPVTSLPGATACITALTLSGLPARRFVFEGFLPAEKKERKNVLSVLATETRTIILYEAPHHLIKTLAELCEVLGETRRLALCRELTKRFEEVTYTTLAEALAFYETGQPRGEYVLVLAGQDRKELIAAQRQQYEALPIASHVARYEAQGLDRKAAMKQVALDRGIPKREVYQALLTDKDENGRTPS